MLARPAAGEFWNVTYSSASGGPSSSIPWASHRAGFWGGIASACVTSRKKASIFPGGVNAIRILPKPPPVYAHTWGTWRGASSESPGRSRCLCSPTSDEEFALDGVEPLVLLVVEVARRAALLAERVFQDQHAGRILGGYFELDRADAKAPHLAEAVFPSLHEQVSRVRRRTVHGRPLYSVLWKHRVISEA